LICPPPRCRCRLPLPSFRADHHTRPRATRDTHYAITPATPAARRHAAATLISSPLSCRQLLFSCRQLQPDAARCHADAATLLPPRRPRHYATMLLRYFHDTPCLRCCCRCCCRHALTLPIAPFLCVIRFSTATPMSAALLP